MIPLRDDIPRVHFPVVVVALITVNTLLYLLENQLNPYQLQSLFHLLGVVPARFVHPDWAAGVGYPAAGILPFLTYMFLHSGFWHLLMNMWMLWIFADNVEDVTGHWRFLAFYFLCGFAALAVHIIFNLDSPIPVVGASGAIAGVMGAYFVLYPHGRVHTFLPVLFLPLFVKIPAVIFLGVWIAIQVLSGVVSQAGSSQGVAWWAHVGGFLAGMILIKYFRRKDRCYFCYDPEEKDYRPFQ